MLRNSIRSSLRTGVYRSLGGFATASGIQYGNALLLQSGDYFLLESGDKLLFEAEEPPSAYDTDAQAYITLVEAADSQSLEAGVKDAINAFVVGCKSDGIWDAIKASCILAGARTLNGALVPLVGTAPTNNNFVSGDYNRETGLVGDGAVKSLDTNRLVVSEAQNDCHVSAFVNATGIAIGSSSGLSGSVVLVVNDPISGRLRNDSYKTGTLNGSSGFAGFSRSSSSTFTARANSSSETLSAVSTAITEGNKYYIFRYLGTHTAARLSFYSIGESLDLALLDSRVSTLMSAIGAAIP